MNRSAWEYRNPTRIVFGVGRLAELASMVDGPALVVTTEGARRRGLAERISDILGGAAIYGGVASNPTVADVDRAISEVRGMEVECLVAVGGGSAIDVGKVLRLALGTAGMTTSELLVPDARWGAIEPLPLVAVPTTAGTGSEVTPTATVWDSEAHRKLSVATPRMYPTAALVDPELSLTLPWPETLSTGLDAYSQCFEAIANTNATPITTAFAERGISLAPDALRTLRADLASLDARSAMAEAALFSGLAISHTRTGLAHSISYPITAHLGVPHGLACALALPAVLAYDAEVDDGRLERVAESAGLGGAADVATSLVALYRELGVGEAIRQHLPDMATIRALAPEMLTPGRADNNVRATDASGVARILDATESWLFTKDPA